MSNNVARTPLWDENPSEVDLLGFDAVVAPIVDTTSGGWCRAQSVPKAVGTRGL